MKDAIRKAEVSIAAILVILAAVVFFLPGNASAGSYDKEYNIANGSVTIEADGNYRIYGNGSSTTNTIKVEYGVSATITLENVNIDVSGIENACAFNIGCSVKTFVGSSGNVTVRLVGSNILKSGKGRAGLEKNSTLPTNMNQGEEGQEGTLTIEGSGSLEAYGGENGAGIGSSGDGLLTFDTANITINGGMVTAVGASGGAGIGGGFQGSGKNIKINGGSVKAVESAYGGKRSAKIGQGVTFTFVMGALPGGGYGGINTYYDGNDAVITNSSNENVYLAKVEGMAGKSVSMDGGASVSYGTHRDDTDLYLYLTGKEHYFTSGNEVRVMNYQGGGFSDIYGKDFSVSGTNLVYKTDYTYENGLLNIKSSKNITIANKNSSSESGDKILVAKDVSANITLNGVKIKSADPFKIADDSTGNVTITLTGDNVLTSTSGSAGLMKNGNGSSIGKLTIKGSGSLKATGGSGGAGIGAGSGASARRITISGGKITAQSSGSGKGIGGGTCSEIVIQGGSVKASSIGCVPTNGSETVYPLTVQNSGKSTVKVDGTTYSTSYHSTNDTSLYLYLTGKYHEITLGSTVKKYDFHVKDEKLVEIGTALVVAASESGQTLIYGEDYTYPVGGKELTILSGKPVTIKNLSSGQSTADRIAVKKDIAADITLAGVNISAGGCAFWIEDDSEADVSVTLADGTINKLTSGTSYAGLQKNGGSGTLLIQGKNGMLVAAGGSSGGAGIGAKKGETASDIRITGGRIKAVGGGSGAGIGGSLDGSASNIYIDGGSVNASSISGTPTHSDGKTKVYLLKLPDAAGKLVRADGNEGVNYTAYTGVENDIYLYLTGEDHTVTLGENSSMVSKLFIFDAKKENFIEHGSAFDIAAASGTITYGTDYTYPESSGILTILTDTPVVIKNKNAKTATKNRIVVAADVNADITLKGVNINVLGTSNAAFGIADGSAGNVTITLADGTVNTLVSGTGCAGLQKNGDYISSKKGKLVIQGENAGTGKLVAQGGSGAAGIGSCNQENSASIKITGGVVIATGGTGGAGIGGGELGSNIQISGGTVTATGFGGAAGIGGGQNGGSKNIIIKGGSVKASSIGCVPTNGTSKVYPLTVSNTDGKDVFIDGSSESYLPVNHKAADGSSNLYLYLTGENHKITLGTGSNAVTREYSFDSANGTFVGNGTSLTITGADGTAPVCGRDYTYPEKNDGSILTILSEKPMVISGESATNDRIVVVAGVSADITLDGVQIDVSGKNLAAAFEIEGSSTGNVTVTLKGRNTLTSGKYCAGLQKNGVYISGQKGRLTIKGDGSLVANGGACGAGIGGGHGEDSSNIAICGGVITAQGGSQGGAGIGGGKGGSGSDITICGGSVKALKGTDAADIGGGKEGDGAVTPTSDGETPVYLLTIANPGNDTVKIAGNLFTPVNHKDADGDTSLYAYLPAKTAADSCVVTVGTRQLKYYFEDSRWNVVPEVEAPEAKADLVYTGGEQELVTAGTATVGTMVYSLSEDGTYSEKIPVGKTAGTYTVWYKVNGISGLEGTAPVSIGAVIAKAQILNIEISGITAAVPGSGFDTDAECSNDELTIGSVKWTPEAEAAAYDTVYTASVAVGLKDKENYRFADKVTAKVNGAEAEAEKQEDGSYLVSYVFPKTDSEFGNKTVEAPVIITNGGIFRDSQTVAITCETEGAAIYYTTDGSDPAEDGSRYEEEFTIYETTTVKAYAVKEGMNDSAVVSEKFTKKSDDDTAGGKTDEGTDGKTDGSTDGSTDGKTDGSTDGKTDEGTDGKTDGSTDGSADGKTDGSTDGKTDEGTDGKTDGSTDGKTDGSTGGKTDEGTDGKTDGSTGGKTDEGTDGKTDGSTGGKTDGTEITSGGNSNHSGAGTGNSSGGNSASTSSSGSSGGSTGGSSGGASGGSSGGASGGEAFGGGAVGDGVSDGSNTVQTPQASSKENGRDTYIVTKSPDGTVTETEKQTKPDGTVTETEKQTKPDGTVTETEKQTKPDGTVTETEKQTKPDGTVTETEKQTKPDGTVTETEKQTKPDGTVTENKREISSDKKTNLTTQVTYDAEGRKTDTSIEVTQQKAGRQMDINAASLAELLNKDEKGNVLGGTNITLNLVAEDGTGKASVTMDSSQLSKKKLVIFEKDENGNLVMADKAISCTVTDDGQMLFNLPDEGNYQLVTEEEAEELNRQIRNSIKPLKEEAVLKEGKTLRFKLSKDCNKANISKITYKQPKDSDIKLNITKNGKISLEKDSEASGTTTVTAIVKLKNGTTKKIKMKIHVK